MASLTTKEKQVLAGLIIPPQPDTLMQLLAEADKPEPDINKIGKLIAADIAISSVILQLVNSAEAMLCNKVTSAQKAVLILGLTRTLPLVRAIALQNAFEPSPAMTRFWQQANQLGLTCIRVAKLLNKPQLTEQAYMLGLFHMAGIPMMLLSFDNYETDMLPKAEQTGWQSLLNDEKAYYGSTHPTVAAMLAKNWQLPRPLIELIFHQYDLTALRGSQFVNELGLTLLAIIKLARRACLPASDTEWQASEAFVLAQLSLNQEQLDELLIELAPNSSR
ncbi:HDOD domain-containing protein [Motilimonas eburnea]|uniref:HDOD domain-containing protein n=1 Tax=Motilimonas eburnea TaxID=1737488 RepID=UPI001E3F7FAB|nr:HDOD domain-containing protein [Motilimonas eburnea]MCE2572846.1 HDOD domain-containing protein [Motilimonas eburnea]